MSLMRIPVRRPRPLDPLLPGLEPPHVAPRIDVVGLELTT